MRIKIGRPSPALVIACISLFVALGGVGYAAATGSIDGREIKNNSVASKDIKNSSVVSKDVKNSTLIGSDISNNSVTGSDVSESSLGKVPSAGQADNAATAGSANSANSATTAGSIGGLTLRKVNFKAPSGTPLTTLFAGQGLTIQASCIGGNIVLEATSSQDDSSIYTKVIDTDSDTADFAADQEGDGFDGTDTQSLLAGGDANPSFVMFNYEGGGGGTVTGNLSADEGNVPACQVVGTITAG